MANSVFLTALSTLLATSILVALTKSDQNIYTTNIDWRIWSNSWLGFGTKTKYEWAQELLTNSHYNSDNSTQYTTAEKCSPIHINIILRHGTRNPSSKVVRKMNKLWTKLKEIGAFSSQSDSFQKFENWINPFNPDIDKDIAEPGRKEHYSLGNYFGSKFQTLLSNFRIDEFKFIVTKASRTQHSAQSFNKGLVSVLSKDASDDVKMSVNDGTLRFFDSCRKYVKDVEDDPESSMKEYLMFKYGKEMVGVHDSVSRRLNIQKKFISLGDICNVFHYCAFERAMTNHSLWCQLLSPEDMPVLEYLMDLKNFWKKSYGHAISYKQSCPLVKAVFDELVRAQAAHMKGSRWTPAVFQFGHAETLIPFYAALGLFRDETELRAHSFAKHHNRQFRASIISPFAANLAFILYDCHDLNSGSEPMDNYRVKLLLNQRPISFPKCDEFCPLRTLLEKYSSYVNTCNYDDICENFVKDEL